MELKLYKSSSSYNVINKKLSLIDTIDIKLKEATNLYSTQIILHNKDNFKNVNYALLLNRFYFAQVQTINNDKFVIITLKEDVLETFKQDILNSSQDIIRKSDAGNVKQQNVSPETVTHYFDSDVKIKQGSSIIMVTSGQPLSTGENNK